MSRKSFIMKGVTLDSFWPGRGVEAPGGLQLRVNHLVIPPARMGSHNVPSSAETCSIGADKNSPSDALFSRILGPPQGPPSTTSPVVGTIRPPFVAPPRRF